MDTTSAKIEINVKDTGRKLADMYPLVKRPSTETLKKYGLSLSEWEEHLHRQGGVCSVCLKISSTGRLVTDHEHVKGWKKMPPEQRKLYVRGLLCWVDNHYTLGKGATRDKFIRAAGYLEAYKERQNGRS